MPLIADRFAVDDQGRAVDLATGERVCLTVSTAGGPTEQAAWAERCAWLSMLVHPSVAPLLDYGVIAETSRFEAWGAELGWRGTPRAADQATARAARVMAANGRAAGPMDAGCRAGRAVAVPGPTAGVLAPAFGPDTNECLDALELIGVVRQPDRRLTALGEIFSTQSSGRVVAAAVWSPEGGGTGFAVRTLARVARVAGYVPVDSTVFSDAVRSSTRGRSLVVIARDDEDAGWRAVLDAALDTPHPHIVLFVGACAVRRVHTVSLERQSVDALVQSVCPPGAARRHVRHVMTAARRCQGLRGRFEQLLVGPIGAVADVDRTDRSMSRRGRSSNAERAAEDASVYEVITEGGVAEHRAQVSAVSSRAAATSGPRWPAPGEVGRLRRQLEAAHALMVAGKHQPAERCARQVMHALARRGEWIAATETALFLAGALTRRGRGRAASEMLDIARPWATRSRELGMLQGVALARARAINGLGRASEAESLLEPLLASAVSTGSPAIVEASFELVESLFWQGRFVDAWHRLSLLQPDVAGGSPEAIRLWIARSSVALGRGRIAEAVAEAARARDAALEAGESALEGCALQACALAQLASGDLSQADAAAERALNHARSARDVVLALSLRTLRAEIARRRGHRRPASLLVQRYGRLPDGAIPAALRARIDLLRDLLSGAAPAVAADRRADAAGLPALRLFAPASTASSSAAGPAADDIVDLLRCCQTADEDHAVLLAVCARLRARLRAAGIAFFGLEGGEPSLSAWEGTRPEVASARRVLTANQLVLPHAGSDRVEAGVPVRYAGHVVGVLVASWTTAAAWYADDVSILLSTGAAAAGPALAGVLARRAEDCLAKTSELIGVSPLIADVRAAVERAAVAPFPVLVEGESGSGKELVARLLHKLGARRDRPFCTLNCAALPEELVESELFGHARGAFTGAAAERRGVFEEAHSGTIFLDEVGELSPRAQAKLLRTIQEGEIRRVGENTTRRVDVRLVTATNRNLRDESAAGRFRLDLLYRLDVIRIAVPPLRDRRDDIPVLAEVFWRSATGRVGSHATLSAATVSALARYNWPGNVRELQNVLASLAVRCAKRGVVSPSALPEVFGEPRVAGSFLLESARRTFDRAFIQAALVRAGGQRTRAAEELGVSRQGLAKLMARLGLDEGASSPRPTASGGG